MTLSDYPDYQTAQEHANRIYATGINHALPVKVQNTVGPFAANAAWGPVTFTFTVGAAYELLIFPQTAADPFITDVIVTHKDSAGTTVYVEEFTVSNVFAIASFPSAPAVIRGNLHGPTLTVSGLTASSAYINTVTGAVGLVAGGIFVNAYALPALLPEGRPQKMSTPNQGFLIAQESISAAASTSTILGAMADWSGKAWLNAHSQTGGGFNGNPFIRSFTVTNGTGMLYATRFALLGGANTAYQQEFELDQYFHVLWYFNISTVVGTVDFSVQAEDYA